MRNQKLTNDMWLTRKEAAKLLGVSPATMGLWVTRKTYNLPYIKIGRQVQYKIADLKKFIENRTVRFKKAKYA